MYLFILFLFTYLLGALGLALKDTGSTRPGAARVCKETDSAQRPVLAKGARVDLGLLGGPKKPYGSKYIKNTYFGAESI